MRPFSNDSQTRMLWLPEGTILYSTSRIPNKVNFRTARSYFGLDVVIQARKRNGNWFFAEAEGKKEAAFRLTRDVFCPGESNPIVLQGNCLRDQRQPIGQGYTFGFSRVDTDADGVPDRSGGQDFYRVQAMLDAQTAATLNIDQTIVFDLFDRDLDVYEESGVLFRLDREHPLRSFVFTGSEYVPCGTTTRSEVKQTVVEETYAKASGKVGASFWNWFSATVEAGGGVKSTDGGTELVSSTLSTTKSTLFRQWSFIEHTPAGGGESNSIPFIVEKLFRCDVGSGSSFPTDQVASVKIGFYNDIIDSNDYYEFRRPGDYIVSDEEIFDFLDQPVFISVNDPEDQAWVIDQIKVRFPELDHYRTLFVYSQLNLACPEVHRSKCIAVSNRSSP
ncbi:hypothetical protein So717_28710 [Roseobacter cerasinus]|uniref:Uncharacterized protein n=2 Tax=Roseobacter cerasinus TaxID=2602289 RepID=A0A640VRU8_9RHOB|nr:hypothetical protein So717_28710 [Roseobacter cerasinus]